MNAVLEQTRHRFCQEGLKPQRAKKLKCEAKELGHMF